MPFHLNERIRLARRRLKQKEAQCRPSGPSMGTRKQAKYLAFSDGRIWDVSKYTDKYIHLIRNQAAKNGWSCFYKDTLSEIREMNRVKGDETVEWPPKEFLYLDVDHDDGLERHLVGSFAGGELTIARCYLGTILEWDWDGDPPAHEDLPFVDHLINLFDGNGPYITHTALTKPAPESATLSPVAWLVDEETSNHIRRRGIGQPGHSAHIPDAELDEGAPLLWSIEVYI
jgi:hypothetical protein